MKTAYVLVQIRPGQCCVEVASVRIFSDERPTVCLGGGSYTTLCKVEAPTYEQACERAREAVKLGWPWIYPLLERERGDEPPRVVGGRYFCPCGADHDRGPVDGQRAYRCLRCGDTREVASENISTVEDEAAAQAKAEEAQRVHYGCLQAMSRVLNLSQDLEDIHNDGRMTSGQKVQDMLRKAQDIQVTAVGYLGE